MSVSLLLLKGLLGLLRIVTDATVCENRIRLLKGSNARLKIVGFERMAVGVALGP